MIIFKSILTTLLASVAYKGGWGTVCARDRDPYKLVSCGKFINETFFVLFIKH
jgi:hypothetical protein